MSEEIQLKIDAIKAPFQSVIEAADAIPALVDAEVKAFGESEFARGQASIVLPSPTLPDGSPNPDLIYTQAQMDDAFAKAHAENDEEVAGLNASLSEKDAKIVELEAALGAKEQEKLEALAAQAVDIGSKIEAVEVDNLDLAAMLKGKTAESFK